MEIVHNGKNRRSHTTESSTTQRKSITGQNFININRNELTGIKGITRIDGAIDFFTKYLLSNTIKFKSVYSVRLYELITQFRNKRNGKTDEFPLEIFRKQLGIEPKQYQGMSDFKKYVLDKAVGEINEHSDLLVGYDQIKDGRTITGFCFKFEIKKQSVNKQNNIDKKAIVTGKHIF